MKFGSCAMRAIEPCQDRNVAALRWMSYVPQGCLAELTVEVTCMGIGFEVACTGIKRRFQFLIHPEKNVSQADSARVRGRNFFLLHIGKKCTLLAGVDKIKEICIVGSLLKQTYRSEKSTKVGEWS